MEDIILTKEEVRLIHSALLYTYGGVSVLPRCQTPDASYLPRLEYLIEKFNPIIEADLPEQCLLIFPASIGEAVMIPVTHAARAVYEDFSNDGEFITAHPSIAEGLNDIEANYKIVSANANTKA